MVIELRKSYWQSIRSLLSCANYGLPHHVSLAIIELVEPINILSHLEGKLNSVKAKGIFCKIHPNGAHNTAWMKTDGATKTSRIF
jgi:hypothetical protein